MSVWKKRKRSGYDGYRYDDVGLGAYGSLDYYTDYMPASATWLAIMASALSGSFGLKIERGEQWKADNSKRVLVYAAKSTEQLQRREALALLLYYVGLTIYTQPIAHAKDETGDREKAFMETLTDAFVSARISREYAGSATEMRTIQRQGYDGAKIVLDNLDKKAEAYAKRAEEIKKDPDGVHSMEEAQAEGYAQHLEQTGNKTEAVKIRLGIKKSREEILRRAAIMATGLYAERVAIMAQRFYYGYELEYYITKPYTAEKAETLALAVAGSMMGNRIESVETSKEALEFYHKHIEPIVGTLPALGIERDASQQGSGASRIEASGGSKGGDGKAGSGSSIIKDMTPGKDARGLDNTLDELRNKKEYKEQSENRKGYSPTGLGFTGLETYAFYLMPHRGRLAYVRSAIARKLDHNKPSNPRGAYRRGQELATRRLYRHRLGDQKLFARREIAAKRSYAFAIYGDASGSTLSQYKSGRLILDEIMAAECIAAEALERVDGAKYTMGIFSGEVQPLKKSGEKLNRDEAMRRSHSAVGGGTDIEAATRQALKDIRQDDADRKLAIIITDGDIDSHRYAEDIEKHRKSGEHLAILIISKGPEHEMNILRSQLQLHRGCSKGLRDREIVVRGIKLRNVERVPEFVAETLLHKFL